MRSTARLLPVPAVDSPADYTGEFGPVTTSSRMNGVITAALGLVSWVSYLPDLTEPHYQTSSDLPYRIFNGPLVVVSMTRRREDRLGAED